MQIEYYKSSSTVKPDLIDNYSSKYVVYLRKNIVQKEQYFSPEDEENTEPIIMYEYDEAKLTKDEYKQYLQELSIIDIEQQRADIDYIALMSGISLEDNL